MDHLNQYRAIIQQILQEYHQLQQASADADWESVLLVDRAEDRYLLMRLGWQGTTRINRNTIHVRLKNQKIWIEEDETEDSVATELLQLGVPHQDIVLAFHPPPLRQYTEFAIA
jgi:XisI protein